MSANGVGVENFVITSKIHLETNNLSNRAVYDWRADGEKGGSVDGS